MVWKKDAPQGHEVSKIRWELVPYTRGRGLDLGCGPEKGFPHFRGIDSNKDAALFGIHAMAADFIIPTCEVLDDFANASQDFIFSSHLLEHIVEHEKALREWWRILRPGGYMCLYLPHKDSLSEHRHVRRES
jgi:predicted SAM-dependent methyltransferase